jgi:hypothetical protein
LFLDAVAPLAALRESQGIAVAVLDVEDIYDEFSYGEKDPQAIKDFLAHARNAWARSPRWALLVGDASVDPRDRLGRGDFDLVPTRLIETAYLETASDDWFADLEGTGVPSLAVGRLPVRTVEEAQTVVAKIVGYGGSSGNWQRQALLVADAADSFDFPGQTDALGAQLPPGFEIARIARGAAPDSEVRERLLATLARGNLLVTFLGHGSVDVWRGSVFTGADARALENGSRLPLVVGLTCLNGYFHDVYSESLAESFLLAPDGGAVAVWTSSGLTEPAGQVTMGREFLRALFGPTPLSIGEAAATAKAATGNRDVRRTWILFGDPSMRLGT